MASMMESVTGENVTPWPRDIVNKCPELAASLDLEEYSQGLGWVTVGLAKRGENISNWVTGRLSQLSHWRQCEDSPIGWYPLKTEAVASAPRRGSIDLRTHVYSRPLTPHLPKPLFKSSLPAPQPRFMSALNDPDTCHADLTWPRTSRRLSSSSRRPPGTGGLSSQTGRGRSGLRRPERGTR